MDLDLHFRQPQHCFDERKRWVCQIASALAYLHTHAVIHRDLKPLNILLDNKNQCLLTDFGIARSFTQTGSLTANVGTGYFMAPEVIDYSHSLISTVLSKDA